MASLSSFFKSERFSDTLLVLIYSSNGAPQGSDPSATSPAETTTLPAKNAASSASSSRGKRKADTMDETEEHDIIISIPAHMLTLSENSEYFNTLLSTAVPRQRVGDCPQKMIKVFADSVEDLYAMEAVAEFFYTGKLSVFCTEEVQPDREGLGKNTTVLQRLLLTLLVASRWQAIRCQSACVSAVAAMPIAGMTWEDCQAMYNLPAFLREDPEASVMMDHAMKLVLTLSNAEGVADPLVFSEFLSSRLHSLPPSVLLALLKSGLLGHAGMLVLLSSDVQVAASEDELALHFSRYLLGKAGQKCSTQEVKQLKDELRYQYLSNAFVGFTLFDIPCLCLTSPELAKLVYLRNLEGFESIPASLRLASVPAAWYKPARTQEGTPSDSFQLTLDVSRSALSDFLQTSSEQLRIGGVHILHSGIVQHKGLEWNMRLLMSSSTMGRIPVPCIIIGASVPAGSHSLQHGPTYAEMKLRLDNTSNTFESTGKTWIGLGTSWGTVFQNGKGDALDISSWESVITDGRLRFLATVKVLS